MIINTNYPQHPKKKKRLKQFKGGYRAYLASNQWNALRKRKLTDVGYHCQVCNSSENLQVHHKTYKRLFHEKLNDLTVLCSHCHNLYHQTKIANRLSEREADLQVYNLLMKDMEVS